MQINPLCKFGKYRESQKIKEARCESRCQRSCRFIEVVVQRGTRDLNLGPCLYTSAILNLNLPRLADESRLAMVD